MKTKAAAAASSESATWLETVKSFRKVVVGKADGVVNSISSVVAARWEFFKSLERYYGKGQKNKPKKGARQKSKSKGVQATSAPSPIFSEVFFTSSEKGWVRAAELKASVIESSKWSISRLGAALGQDVHEHTAAGLTIALLLSIILVTGNIYKRRVPRVRARAHVVSRSATDGMVGGGDSGDPLSTVAAAPAEPGIEMESDPIEVSGRKDANVDPDTRDAASEEPSKPTSPSELLGPVATFEPAKGPISLSAAEAGAREPATPEVPRCQPTAPRKAVPAALVTKVPGDAAADIGPKATELASPAPSNPLVEEEEGYASVEPRGRAAKVGEAIVDADGHPSNLVEDRAAGYTDDVAAVALVKEEEMQASAHPTVDVATVTPEAGNVIAQEVSEKTLVSFAFLLRLLASSSLTTVSYDPHYTGT